MGNFIKNFFSFVAYWIVVPLILVEIFLFVRLIIKKVASRENRISAEAGFWAGLVLFIIYFIYEIPLFKTPEFKKITTLGIDISGIIIGTLFGFFFLFGMKRWIPTKIVGFIVMFLTFSSSSALYSYVFIQTFNKFLLSLTLGVGLGVLLHITVWPKSIHDIVVKS